MVVTLVVIICLETVILLLLAMKVASMRGIINHHESQMQQLSESHARELQSRIEADRQLLSQQSRSSAEAAEKQAESAQLALSRQQRAFDEAKQLLVSQYEKQLQQQKADFDKAYAALTERWEKELVALREEFKNCAGKMMEERTEKLDATNQKQMKELFEPFREKLKELKEQLDTSQKERATLQTAVTEKLESVKKNADKMVSETDKLTNALKGTNKLQGNWGELQLEQALVDCGLVKEVNFDMQMAITDQNGHAFSGHNRGSQIPDATVRLPNGRRVFIDSKMSMTAYMRYLEATDDASRKVALEEHMASIKSHIRALSTKDYPGVGNSAIPNSSFENTIMFMGNEGALMLALSTEPSLWENTMRVNKVILVSRMSLYPLLWLIQKSWQIEKQSKNQAEILRQTALLVERLDGFVKNYCVFGRKIDEVQAAYRKNLSSLCESNQSVVKTGGRIAALMGKQVTMDSLLPGQEDKKELPGDIRPADDW